MSAVQPYGAKWQEVSLMPTFEHEQFFFFLLYSPSYWLAHIYRKKRNLKGLELPSDFDKVREIYRRIGNIYESTFEDWWQGGGYKLFATKSIEKKLSLNIDITKSQSEVLKEIKEAVEKAYRSKEFDRLDQGITFLKNKINIASLNDRKVFVMIRAVVTRQSGKDTENWRVMVKARSLSKWIEGLSFDSPATNKNLKARVALTELASKYHKEALRISENAARLNFPCLDPIDTGLSFDFEVIADLLWNYKKLEDEMLKRYEGQPEKLIRDQYTQEIKRHFRKKRRIEKAVDKAVKQKKSKDESLD